MPGDFRSPTLLCLWLLAGGEYEEEEGPPGEEDEVGVSLTSGPGDPACPAALVHKADRCDFTATKTEARGGHAVNTLNYPAFAERLPLTGAHSRPNCC